MHEFSSLLSLCYPYGTDDFETLEKIKLKKIIGLFFCVATILKIRNGRAEKKQACH
jgi:hypothetical protein